jgi:hypothetical protein
MSEKSVLVITNVYVVEQCLVKKWQTTFSKEDTRAV